MDNKAPRGITPYNGGFFPELGMRLKLIVRLLGDRRVNLFLKILPLASLVYLIFPDLAPGPVDDALIIWLGSYAFVELCPDNVVEEHISKLRHIEISEQPVAKSTPVDVVDAEFKDVDKV
jgi:hypothetical protein